jgi:acyl-coenzyme A thioesterase PaaI-like protein
MTGISAYRHSLGLRESRDRREHVMPFQPGLLGRPGFLHGGAIAGLLASVCDSAAETEGDGHEAATTTMNYLRGGRERDTFATATVQARTARFLIIEATAWQESPDKPIARMARTYLRR